MGDLSSARGGSTHALLVRLISPVAKSADNGDADRDVQRDEHQRQNADESEDGSVVKHGLSTFLS